MVLRKGLCEYSTITHTTTSPAAAMPASGSFFQMPIMQSFWNPWSDPPKYTRQRDLGLCPDEQPFPNNWESGFGPPDDREYGLKDMDRPHGDAIIFSSSAILPKIYFSSMNI
jgi:hypothetical protein